MSVKVDVAELGSVLQEHDYAYLLSPGRERPHVVTVHPILNHGLLLVPEAGRTAMTLAPEHPAVTVVFPPREAGGYTLIVDADAEVEAGGGDGTEGEPAGTPGTGLVLTPVHAVLHRPAAAGTGPEAGHEGCGSDCHPVEVDPG